MQLKATSTKEVLLGELSKIFRIANFKNTVGQLPFYIYTSNLKIFYCTLSIYTVIPLIWNVRLVLNTDLKFNSASQQTFVLVKTSWRHLSSSSSKDVFKTSWSRRICSPQPYVFRRRLQDVLVKTNIFILAIHLQDFKTFSRRLQDVFKTSCKKVFKTSSRRLQDVLKTSSKRLQDIFETSSRRIINLNCSC